MTAEQGFDLHPLAAQDITDIWDFIAEHDLLAARRVREDILSAIRRLVAFPYQGHKRPDLTSRPLRFAIVRYYPRIAIGGLKKSAVKRNALTGCVL